ncbi:MAG: hypothetical protein ACTS6J_01785 [Burkholderiales bacterium]
MPARQRGAALLVLLALVSVVLIYAVVAGLNRSAAGMAQARAQKTATALAQAKEALIAYAVTYGDEPAHVRRIPGFLPCPDRNVGPGTNPEGEADTACGSFLVSVMGRLPWKTLGLDALKDGSGECLWYAVSGTYKSNPNGVTKNNVTSSDPASNNMMNWDTNGQFQVFDTNNNTLAGSAEDNRAVAVIFAPGAALPGQDRTPVAGTPVCGGHYSAAAYLEAAMGIDNSSLDPASSPASVTDVSSFIAGAGSETFNDQLVYIARADIWNAIKKRSDFNNNLRALTRRAAECTAMYATKNSAGADDKRLPWAADVSMSSLDHYAVDRRYQDVSDEMSGRLAYLVRKSDDKTNNLLSDNADLGYTDILLLTSGSYCAYAPEEKIWYDNWKDHLFYAVADRYNPSASHLTASCSSSKCLKISDGINTFTYYAAVVLFAGEKLSGQNRNTLSDKSRISNYLETTNTSSNSSGNNTYRGGSASSAFNDFVYAIDTNLAVKCYDAASGTMKSAPSSSCP